MSARKAWKYISAISQTVLPSRAAPFSILVFAAVGVAGEVADIRDVHHVPHPEALVQQGPLEDVLEDVRAEVADVGVVVDGRPAGVHAHLVVVDGAELIHAAGHRVCRV